jgi:hypothetical protein
MQMMDLMSYAEQFYDSIATRRLMANQPEKSKYSPSVSIVAAETVASVKK